MLATATGVLRGGTLSATAAERSAAAASALRAMPLGGSITDGLGSSNGNGFRGPLWDESSAKGDSLDFVGTSRAGSTTDLDNEGHSGRRIDQIASLTDASLARYRPTVVTLVIGTNDLGHNCQVPPAPDRLDSRNDEVVADAPDATVLVASGAVSTDPTIEANRAACNQRIPGMVQAEQAVGKHVRYARGALANGDPADGRHPHQKRGSSDARGAASAPGDHLLRSRDQAGVRASRRLRGAQGRPVRYPPMEVKYSVAGSSRPSSVRTRVMARPWLRPVRASAPATITTPSPSR